MYSREPEKQFVFFMNEISSLQLRIYLIKVGTVVGVDINTMKTIFFYYFMLSFLTRVCQISNLHVNKEKLLIDNFFSFTCLCVSAV